MFIDRPDLKQTTYSELKNSSSKMENYCIKGFVFCTEIKLKEQIYDLIPIQVDNDYFMMVKTGVCINRNAILQ
ncbi:hypothetical protein CDAR_443961 [Caerostris darwini]|uniref:Uncharacterized protein n=1 Tax=Caerostris darwini TaxID=1538125 RepID=A0AAV4XBG3_9ARAC|nr:hypothetical protein CDAR_443961 [Caerostris darwini]